MAPEPTTHHQADAAASFKPFVPADVVLPEFTPRAILLGAFLGIIFGAVSVYLALRAGLTVSASIPVAVISITVFKWLGKSTILENNIVQTVGSAGESIAAGTVFTLPALIFLGYTLDYWRIFPLALGGGLLGVLFVVPLRNALVVKEHGNLTFPEGKACADVLITGERGGIQAGKVFGGAAIGIIYKFLMGEQGGLFFWKATPEWHPAWYPGSTFAGEITPEYLGVGYIIGTRVAGTMVAGGVLSWLVLIPIIKFFGAHVPDAMYPGTMPIGQMTETQIWSSYIRYVGAGAVTAAGIITLGRTVPTIVSSFKSTFSQLKNSKLAAGLKIERTARDLPLTVIAGGSVLVVGFLWALLSFHINPMASGNLISALLMVLFGFFFATVSARIVGLIGSSSNPISGMTIATLMGTCLIFVLVGWTGGMYSAIALSIGAVVAIGGASAGATTQDLKTGFLVGGTPSKQELGYAIGVMTSVFVVGLTMQLLNSSATKVKPLHISDVSITSSMKQQGPATYEGRKYEVISVIGSAKIPDGRYFYDPANRQIDYQQVMGIGSTDYPAPQATLMSVVINGILTRKLPWTLVLFGAFTVIVLELCGIHSLAFAVGLYLPISTTAPIFAGGVIKWLVDRSKRTEEEVSESETGSGALFSSGLIAGGSLGGLALATVVGFQKEQAVALGTRWFPRFAQSDFAALIIFTGLAALLYFVAISKGQARSPET
ncbi:MAG: oligopeptide transporter, OPT family [Acidobacteria bacterium]|nr:MAG: oligopeptide transporter, OPT family [Acidobacteriota bacterium]